LALRSADLRKWRWVHTWSSLICTHSLLVLCVTGLPLVFADEIEAAFPGNGPIIADNAGSSVSLDMIALAAQRHDPGQAIRFVFPDDDTPTVQVVMAPSAEAPLAQAHTLTFDAHAGRLLRDSARPGEAGAAPLMSIFLRVHSQLFMGLPGELLLALMALLFLAALISGVVLYAPFARRAPFGTIRRDGSSLLRWLDLHNVLGVVISAWLLVVGFTGLLNALSTPLFGIWQLTDVKRILSPYIAHDAVRPIAPLQEAVNTALKAVPGMKLVSITYPSHFNSSPLHYIVWTAGDSPLTSRLETPVMVDARTGKLTRVVPMPGYLRALEISRPLHFGDYGGLPLKLLWAAFDLIAIIILASGLYLWIARRVGSRTSAELRDLALAEEMP
jgi:uncharacterized iron-regulated membrane protein